MILPLIYSLANQKKVKAEIYPFEKVDSNKLSDAFKMPINDSFESQKYNLSPRQKQLQNGPNFVTLSQISEKKKIEIIKVGFQLNQEGKISLKKYYENTEEYSLFEWKG